MRTVYGNVEEEMPRDAPEPLGKEVVLTCYVDANLGHDFVTGKSVTGVLHFINQTPIEWYSKKQPTVETATYGSEYVATKTAIQQIMGLRIYVRYLGVRIEGGTYLFGDNGSVVTNTSLPHSPLKKRHHLLSYHYSREAIASKAVNYHFIPGHLNPADILTKHWGYQQVWASALRPIMFWQGDTSSLLGDEMQPQPRKKSMEGKDNTDVDATRCEPQPKGSKKTTEIVTTGGTSGALLNSADGQTERIDEDGMLESDCVFGD
jgi:hypothetical protein